MNCKVRDKKGFTLIETLLTLAILIILLSISMPFAGNLAKELKMMQMDSAAKEIFLAAQNRLVHIKSMGQLGNDGVFQLAMNNTTLFSENATSRKLSVNGDFGGLAPDGYPEGDEGWKELYYLRSDDPIVEKYLLSDLSFDAIEGSFIMEMNPVTGDVYSVFYSEKTDNESNLKSIYNSLYTARAKKSRMAFYVGYYSGKGGRTQVSESFEPKVEVINGEDLYLKITSSGIRRKNPSFLNIKINLKDEHGNIYNLNDIHGNSPAVTITTNQLTTYVLLDSLRTDSTGRLSFENITNHELNPGDNIKVEVKVEYNPSEGTPIGTDDDKIAIAEFNSLFDTGSKTNEGESEILISKLRHLNNLRESIFKVDSKVNKIKVKQTNEINFDFKLGVDKTTPDKKVLTLDDFHPSYEGKNPISKFEPVFNRTIFGMDGIKGIGEYEGNGNTINDFIIKSDGSNVGLFAQLNCNVSNVLIRDMEISGNNNVGTLAGQAFGGKITNCGAYVNTHNYNNILYSNIPQRLEKYTVKGNNNVGGLVGRNYNTIIDKAFSAVYVNGMSKYIGGLAGYSNGSIIKNSYASGDLISESADFVGGLVGGLTSGSIKNCYSTSDITGNQYLGGLVGNVRNIANVDDSNSYGLVKKDKINATDYIGGFSGSISGNYNNCNYLKQSRYNSSFPKVNQNGVNSRTYKYLSNNIINPKELFKPYDIKLIQDVNEKFPFKRVTEIHFGDWPEKIKAKTTLIYYEKYSDGSFGYYGKGSTTGEINYEWKLDTLKNQKYLSKYGLYLVEDGYGILSGDELKSINYALNPNNTTTADNSPAVPVSMNLEATNQFVNIDKPVSLKFEITDSADEEDFTMENSYVYRLPFNLQENRNTKDNAFNSRLKIWSEDIKDLDKNKKEVYLFIYCPHFAKSVLSPSDTKIVNTNLLDPPRGQVYIRSPRHLNALGRYPYYWNATNSSYDNLVYNQEIDLDFGKYNKRYCGVNFDLMNTDLGYEYKNKPIGMDGGNRASQFRYTYDGHGYNIIDYCQKIYKGEAPGGQSYKFTGLFGEIRRATLKNIHMVASKPEKDWFNSSSAYIKTYGVNSNQSAVAVGGLVGLLYITKDEGMNVEIASKKTVVSNCSISGYDVILSIDGLNTNSAVGGLIGMSMGTVTNSSAVCGLVANDSIKSLGRSYHSAGGFAGSKIHGTLKNCYAGGTLRATDSRWFYMGGIVGGQIFTWSPFSHNWNSIWNSGITNCYAFTKAADLSIGSTAYFPIADPGKKFPEYSLDGRMNCAYFEPGGYLPGQLSRFTSFAKFSEIPCYSMAELKDAIGVLRTSVVDFDFDLVEDSYVYPWTESLKGLPYPIGYSSVYGDGDSNSENYHRVHYGDWIQ